VMMVQRPSDDGRFVRNKNSIRAEFWHLLGDLDALELSGV